MTTQMACTQAYRENSSRGKKDGRLREGRGVSRPPLRFDEFRARACFCKLLFCVLQMVRASVWPHLPDVLLLRQDHLRGQQKGEQQPRRRK